MPPGWSYVFFFIYNYTPIVLEENLKMEMTCGSLQIQTQCKTMALLDLCARKSDCLVRFRNTSQHSNSNSELLWGNKHFKSCLLVALLRDLKKLEFRLFTRQLYDVVPSASFWSIYHSQITEKSHFGFMLKWFGVIFIHVTWVSSFLVWTCHQSPVASVLSLWYNYVM